MCIVKLQGLYIILVYKSGEMWVYVSMSFSIRSKQKRVQRDSFIKELVKDGFVKLYTTMYVLYCTTLGNALIHKRRVMEKMLPFGRISIILVADQQASLSYHHIGTKQDEKKEKELPEIPELIEIF